ncbi:MAG: ABC1 kinase family protein [Gemmatimonadaceae bacterium]
MILAPRYLPRLAATVGLYLRYVRKDFAGRGGLSGSLQNETALSASRDGTASRAAAFRKRLVDLGPAYIKLGQVLSTRPDLIPDSYIAELERLQDDVGAIPYTDVERTIEQTFSARMSKLFASFDDTPLGTASLGQVHAAELRDGRPVVVKVQRPGIRDALADDLAYFRELARFLTNRTRAGSRIDMVGIVQHLERALVDELDYRNEARNSATFRRSLAGFPRLLIPKVIEAYTAERVITIERIHGMKIDEVPSIARGEHDFRLLAVEFSRAYLQQITIDGHFHADPHPGNIFIVLPGRDNPDTPAEAAANDTREEQRPASTPLSKIEQEAQTEAADPVAEDEPKLALIDFGMTAYLSSGLRENIVRLLLDVADNRGDGAAETMIEMGEAAEGFDRGGYVRDIAALVSRNYDRAVGEIKAGTLIYEMINISYQRGLKLPAELTLLAKALFNLDAVTRALDPDYSPMNAIREFGNRLAADRAKREMSPMRLYQVATQTADLMGSLPRRLDAITARLAANELGLRLDAPQLPSLLQGVQKIANRILTGLVLCGLLIASAMLMPYRRQLGTTGFVIAALLGVYMVISILVKDRTRRL